MEVEVTYEKKVKESRKVEVPSYSRSYIGFYKIISDKECIYVAPDGTIGVEIQTRSIDFAAQFGTEPSNEQEFNEAFNRAIALIQEKNGNS